MQRRFLIGGIAILATFSICLVGFFLVSEGKPDGLETVLEGQEVEESTPVWMAPLDYGSDYATTLLMGMIGFGLVLLATFGYLKIVSKKKQQGTK